MTTEKPHLADGVTIRRLTDPEAGCHWFGYYDKFETSPDDRYVLGMRVGFERRRPTGDDPVEIAMIDTHERDRWIPLGQSRAWGWQQGCMLQWIPASPREVMWNDREADRFVARVHDVTSGATRTLPRAVYTLAPDGRWGVGHDFARLNHCRPGYGYPGIEDPQADVPAPADSGIWRIDVASGESELLVTLEELAGFERSTENLPQETHYVNHLLISPDGGRIEFLHRWYPSPRRGEGEYKTRMLTMDQAGGDLRLVDDTGDASHFIWDDPEHLLVACSATTEKRALHRIAWRDRKAEVVDTANLPQPNGHVTLLPGTNGRWLLTDDCGSTRAVYLHDRESGRVLTVAQGLLPGGPYHGEDRIDLHPRSDRLGRQVVIDSGHEGHGRQIHLLDIGALRDREIGGQA